MVPARLAKHFPLSGGFIHMIMISVWQVITDFTNFQDIGNITTILGDFASVIFTNATFDNATVTDIRNAVCTNNTADNLFLRIFNFQNE